MPDADRSVVRYASGVYAVFGVAAVAAVSQPHVWLLAAALVTQAVAGFFTPLGPEARAPSH